MDEPAIRSWIADTRALLDRLERELKPAESSGETLDAWVVRWAADRERRGHGDELAKYQQWIAPHLGALPVAGISWRELECWVEWIEGQVLHGALRATTANRIWTVLASMMRDSYAARTRDLRVRQDNSRNGGAGRRRGNRGKGAGMNARTSTGRGLRLGMAKSRLQEYREKAKLLAESITWLAELDSDEARAAIDRAHNALGLGESYVRNAICALIYSIAKSGKDGDGDIRGFVDALATDPLMRVHFKPGNMRPETVQFAVEAWRRAPGTRRGPHPEKWAATLALLQECGLAENLTPDAVRRSWNRRLK